jgi:hypothetical protein
MNFDKLCNSILERVFHGTPHDVIGSFSLNKIGSGEGAQVYGWGLYFAENPKVADSYRKNVTHKDFINKVAEVYDEYSSPEEADDALESAGLTANQMALVKALQKEDWWGFDYPHQAVRAALREADNFEHGEEVDKALKTFGNLYEVEINADKENDFLDWDKPFNEQSVNIQNKLKNINLEDRYEIGKSAGSLQYGFYSKENGYLDTDKPSFRTEEEAINFLKNPTGETLYSEIDYDPKKASNNLKTFGIKGIKYLDQDSRITGEGTYNYVVFDPSVIRIVSKNGEFVMQSKTPENVEI